MQNIFLLLKNHKPEKSTERFKTIIISAIVAIGIWFMVIYINDPSITITLKDIDAKIIGEETLKDNGYVITGRDDLPYMSVKVSGRRSDLIDYMDKVYIKVDVSKAIEPGEQEFPTEVSIPSASLTLEKTNLSKLNLNVEPLKEKSIQVLIKQTGSNKDYIINSQIIDDFVDISGAASEMDNVAYALATVDISSITDESEADYIYTMYDKNNSPIEKSETLEASKATVHVKNTPYSKMSLPITPILSDELSEEYMIDIAKTTISPASIEIGVGPDFSEKTLYVTVDKMTNTEAEYFINTSPDIYIPDGTSKVKIKPAIVKKTTKTFTIPITAINIPEGTSADFIQEITIIADCAEDVTASDIKAEINLSGLDKGTHIVPLIIGSQKTVSVPAQEINVTIK